MRKHALLSASASERWLNCTPSAVLESKVKAASSAYADEGTTAHKLAEIELAFYFEHIDRLTYNKEFKEIEKSEYYNDSMAEYVNDYVVFVVERFNSYDKAYIFFEQHIDLSAYVPEGFGTTDVVILTPNVIEEIDFKYGAGVRVDAVNNKQLMLYALGAYNEFSFIYNPAHVIVSIYQPRINNFSSWRLTTSKLLSWANKILKPKAELAFNGKGELTPGDWCRFCKVKATCRAFAEKQLALARLDFNTIETKKPPTKERLTDKEISRILLNVSLFKNWLSSIETYALDAAVNHGKQWPGMKLVQGRSNRKFSDVDKVTALLLKRYSEDKILEKKLLALTKLEKQLTPKVFNKLLNKYIVKPEGALTLVDVNDKRPAHNSLESAKKDFL